ncbi:hypothetical protein ACSQ6I_26140 [Anabaena sp. WFMT]|uniref:hypothetical protein n=1 Tax=Anabaena sp. WFMT TaxID=3449730 RepID=UPI003F243C4E
MSDKVISSELLTELSNDEQEVLTGGYLYVSPGYGYGWGGYGRPHRGGGYGRHHYGHGRRPHHYHGYGW